MVVESGTKKEVNPTNLPKKWMPSRGTWSKTG